MATVPARLDHLVYATPTLVGTVDALASALGVRPTPGGRHPGMGTCNYLLALGGASYLEVIGPDPDQPGPAAPRPFGIDGLAGPALMAWAMAVDDIDATIATARARGYDPGDAVAMSRRTVEGAELHWRLTFPPSALVGVVPFLIAWGDTPHPSRSAPPGATVVSLRAGHPDAAAARALEALGAGLVAERSPEPFLEAVVRGPAGEVTLRGAGPR